MVAILLTGDEELPEMSFTYYTANFSEEKLISDLEEVFSSAYIGFSSGES